MAQNPSRKVRWRKIWKYSTSFISSEIFYNQIAIMEVLGKNDKNRSYWAKMEDKWDHTWVYFSRPYFGWYFFYYHHEGKYQKKKNYKIGNFFNMMPLYHKMVNYKCQEQPCPFKANVFPGTFLLFGKWHRYYLNRMLFVYRNLVCYSSTWIVCYSCTGKVSY